jgi:penicillin-binding protein 1A
MVTIYPKLPDVSSLQDYRPLLPLSIYSADGKLIGEFGSERRRLVSIKDVPQCLKAAIIATEDRRFYQHKGVDPVGLARALIANIEEFKSQGASTITMQVAKNVYLSPERTFLRKLYELLITVKLERALTKDQILEIYLNYIYLGNRAYGFAAAADYYFDKSLSQLNLAECTMLAGLPKAPNAFNPLRNHTRSKTRQEHVLGRMVTEGFISKAQAEQALSTPLQFASQNQNPIDHNYAAYVSEMVRQMVQEQYGEQAYTAGLRVYTSINSTDQIAAYQALRKGLRIYDEGKGYRGPEAFIEISDNLQSTQARITEVFENTPESGELKVAVVLQANPKEVIAEVSSGQTIQVSGEGLSFVRKALRPQTKSQYQIRKGAVIRVEKNGQDQWRITQIPEVQGAIVAMSPQTGEIKALVGGFDFELSEFNRVTQALRQAGSSIKPFLYSAALEEGLHPATFINDAPIRVSEEITGNEVWIPQNSDGRFDGPMTMRQGLARSKNMVSIRILQKITPEKAQKWLTHFGFSEKRWPPYLTMALGAGEATPLQLVSAYSVFANAGHYVQPWLIQEIRDHKGKLLASAQPKSPNAFNQVISERNTFIVNSLLNDVTSVGTAARAQSTMERPDIYGKTGTTNDAVDAWFVGFQPTLAAAVWIGYDQPRSLGDRESGGGLGLPVWMEFMQHGLRDVPINTYEPPNQGLVYVSDWMYSENVAGGSVSSLGLDDPMVLPEFEMAEIDSERRENILRLFN